MSGGGTNIEAEIGVGGFAVHSVAQRAISSPVNIYVQEGKIALSFSLHG
jgi:hypothetical protein